MRPLHADTGHAGVGQQQPRSQLTFDQSRPLAEPSGAGTRDGPTVIRPGFDRRDFSDRARAASPASRRNSSTRRAS